MILLIEYTLLFASVLILVALGGCFSEHSGVINIGLEGIMVVGALGGALTMYFMPDGVSNLTLFLMVFLVSALSGGIFSFLLSVAAIQFKADQTLVGTAMNMLATAFASIFVKTINTKANPDNVSSIVKFVGVKDAFELRIGALQINWFVIVTFVLAILAWVILYKTKFGLRLTACGEHPQAADSVGINVAKMRYLGVGISGILGGIGGIVFITAGVSEWNFETGVMGFGFLALAVMIFGQWKPQRIVLAALLFGACRALGNVYSGFDWLASLQLPGGTYLMLPYFVSLLVLVFTSKRSKAPKAEGVPYDKSMR